MDPDKAGDLATIHNISDPQAQKLRHAKARPNPQDKKGSIPNPKP
jgi:hypothetical protein